MCNYGQPKVSVIVPVYNVAQYLPQCIASIIAQTLTEIEIILVDDGSIDTSGAICDEYASNDPRIRVIHKANIGLSAARNDGLTASTAPYVMFADGDDWIEPEFCSRPYEAAIEENADIVLFTYNRVYPDNRIVTVKTKLKDGPLTEDEGLFFNTRIWDAAWVGIYRRELFDTVQFPAGKLYEDTGTTHRLIHEANSIYLINQALYNYRVNRSGSITTAPETREHPDKKEMHL